MRKTALCLAMLFLLCGLALGQTEKVLYSFGTNPSDGRAPLWNASLALDGHGNLFGTTQYAGSFNGGTVFELSPNSDGTWSETTLYNFCYTGSDSCPNGTEPGGTLALDSKGNLYGVTGFGGAASDSCPNGPTGCGVAYELSPPSLPGGPWTETVLYSFCQVSNCEDGRGPIGLTFDELGNLYGTTCCGGSDGTGTVFELSPGSGSTWTEAVLYSFCAEAGCLGGSYPSQGVTYDKIGNLYGSTATGGSTNFGVVFELSPGATWTEAVLYTFPAQTGVDGHDTLVGPMSIDPLGNLYTSATWVKNGDGGYENGELLRLTSGGSDTIYTFKGKEGNAPLNGVIVDAKRRALYGTTSQIKLDAGNVFQIDAHGHETVLYVFCQQTGCADGKYPSGLVEDRSGNLYGVTEFGGAYNEGVVFEITP